MAQIDLSLLRDSNHGDDAWRYPQSIGADFSSSVCHLGPDLGLLSRLGDELKYIGSYPEPRAGRMSAKLAAYHGLDPDQILLTNGATQAIWLIAQALPATQIKLLIPAFSEYEKAFLSNGHRIDKKQIGTFPEHDAFLSDSLILGRPNNPDGSLVSYDRLKHRLELCSHSGHMTIIDESFIDMSTGISLERELCHHKELILIRSLTKSAAIASLRLGYILAHPKIIALIESFQHDWAVNRLALVALEYLLDHDLMRVKADLVSACAAMRNRLKDINKVTPHNSQTNFFLVEQSLLPSPVLKKKLVEDYRILIRDASDFDGLTQKHIRLSLQCDDKITALVCALKEIAEQRSRSLRKD